MPTARCRLASLVCILGLIAVSAPEAVLGQEDSSGRLFRAGAAVSNITPPLGEPIVGGWEPTPATNIHDELHVRCLVLDDGSSRVAFAICDNVGVATEVFDQAREHLAAETTLSPDRVLMASTHTHSATSSTSDNYRDFLARRIADGVRMALENLQPARIGWGSVDEASELFNRRWYVTDPELLKNPFGGVDQVRMNPPRGSKALLRPAGSVDPEISFLSVQSPEGRPIALLANYSLHYVGGVNKGEVSADYFGIFAERIGELIGAEDGFPPFVGIMTNGTSGDVNNIDFQGNPPRMQPYEKMAQVAELVAQRVAEAHEEIDFHDWVPVDIASRDLTLKYRKPDQAMLDYFEAVRSRPEGEPEYHQHERTYARRVRDLAEGPDEVTVLLQVVRIGDLAIAAIPFETFTETGLEIKDRSPFADTFTIELANGKHGYLPTPAQHELGGYETWLGTNRVQKDASVHITETILDLMNELKTK